MHRTPIYKIETYLDSIQIYVKREDLLPISFGGNKQRIAEEYFLDMKNKGKDCIVGYGNARSNLCRIISSMSAMQNIECHIISPADDNGTRKVTSNSILTNECGVTVHTCLKTDVAKTIEAVMNELIQNGKNPYYINGDKYGIGNERTPVCAYAKVYEEIKEQEKELGVKFDYIFLATGTGMTQSGLIAGQLTNKGEEKVVGISVARSKDACKNKIKGYVEAYLERKIDENNIEVVDDYLCGGYGLYNDEIEETILHLYRTKAIHTDPTYTAKAFWGMKEYLKSNEIKNKKVLFIHTGGTPLFFDFIRERSKNIVIDECKDELLIYDFLKEIDNQLPTSLSNRVNLLEYAKKIVDNAVSLAIKENNKIISCAIFYCNDTDKKAAYLTLLGTLIGNEGKGYASALLNATEKRCMLAGMKKIYLDTDIKNNKAIALYSKRGYVIESIDPKVKMVKEI